MRTPAWSRLPRRFPGIDAGTSGVELELAAPEVARVTLDATLDGQAVEFDRVLGFFEPRGPRDPAGCVPPHEATFRRLDGWPAPATLTMRGGQAGAIDASGSHRFMYLGTKHEPVTVAPGWLWIGLRGWESDLQSPLHPTGAGLVYLEPGDYRFHFELARTGELRGRILAPSIAPDLCVALVDEHGGAVETRRKSYTMDTLSPTGADGSFWLQGAPVGAFTLRVGSEAELRAGNASFEHAVTIGAGENPPLEIRLR